MIKVNGMEQIPQVIDVPEWRRSKINTVLFRAACNVFLLQSGAGQATGFLGKNSLGKKRKQKPNQETRNAGKTLSQ